MKLGQRLYLAGPYSKYLDKGQVWTVQQNVDRAMDAVQLVRELGLVPFVPHIAIPNPGPGAHGWRVAMVECLSHLATTHGTLMLPGWQHSRGARIERWLTIRQGRPVFYGLGELARAIRGGV